MAYKTYEDGLSNLFKAAAIAFYGAGCWGTAAGTLGLFAGTLVDTLEGFSAADPVVNFAFDMFFYIAAPCLAIAGASYVAAHTVDQLISSDRRQEWGKKLADMKII